MVYNPEKAERKMSGEKLEGTNNFFINITIDFY